MFVCFTLHNWALWLYLQICSVKKKAESTNFVKTIRSSHLGVSVVITLTCCSESPDSSAPNGAMVSLLMSWEGENVIGFMDYTDTCCKAWTYLFPNTSIPSALPQQLLLLKWDKLLKCSTQLFWIFSISLICVRQTFCIRMDSPPGWLSWQHAAQTPPGSWWFECILGTEWETFINDTCIVYYISASVSHFQMLHCHHWFPSQAAWWALPLSVAWQGNN